MNSKKYIAAVLFLLVLTPVIFAFGGRERNSEPLPVVVQITGVVRLIGSSPLPQLIISGYEFEWFVPREEMDKLNNLQHRIVTVEGEEIVMELMFAGGQPAGTRRELRNIRILEIH